MRFKKNIVWPLLSFPSAFPWCVLIDFDDGESLVMP